MSNFLSYFIGFLLGFIIIGAVLDDYSSTDDQLEACRKQHNVYQCEVQYVPVKVGGE